MSWGRLVALVAGLRSSRRSGRLSITALVKQTRPYRPPHHLIRQREPSAPAPQSPDQVTQTHPTRLPSPDHPIQPHPTCSAVA